MEDKDSFPSKEILEYTDLVFAELENFSERYSSEKY